MVTRQEWISALKSDKYKKGSVYLCRTVEGTSYFCCFGVLCSLDAKETGNVWQGSGNLKYCVWGYEDSCIGVPERLLQAVGVTLEDVGKIQQLNDSSKTFDEVIKYLKGD